jgi:biopolymer transport protein ExbD
MHASSILGGVHRRACCESLTSVRVLVVALLIVAGCKRESVVEQPAAIDAAAVAEVKVDVRVDGGLAIDGRDVKDDAELESRTREIAHDKPVLHAVIHVDEGVPYDRVIDAEHALKRGGAAHMTFAVGGKDAATD